MNLDLEEYKPYLKSQYNGAHSHVFPFRYMLERYAPLKKAVMKFFTCEDRFSRIYQYHIRLVMRFTTAKSLNLSNYLYRSLIKMYKRVQFKGKEHHPTSFTIAWYSTPSVGREEHDMGHLHWGNFENAYNHFTKLARNHVNTVNGGRVIKQAWWGLQGS